MMNITADAIGIGITFSPAFSSRFFSYFSSSHSCVAIFPSREKCRSCENVVYLVPDLSAAARFQIPHRGFHVRVTEPLLYGP